jgi:demethylmenaquinone methyltransferase/2-methoxy-6-polyprenyl-1,4-benzoquinol methylase
LWEDEVEKGQDSKLLHTTLPVDTETLTSMIASTGIDYEKVNHCISFFQDDRARQIGLRKIGTSHGIVLELGSGPGNFTCMLSPYVKGFLVCLDFSDSLLRVGRSRINEPRIGYIRGVFEFLPFRERIISITATAYALRDSSDKHRVLSEINSVLKENGRLIVIDVGRPNNPINDKFLSIYMRFIVPIIGGLVAKRGYMNPWTYLYKTYELLPVNERFQEMLDKRIGYSRVEEISFGGLIVATARKKR